MSEILTDEARAAILARAAATNEDNCLYYMIGNCLSRGLRDPCLACLVPALLADGDAMREQVATLTQERDAERRLRIEDATGKIDAERERDTERAARLAAEAKLAEWLDEQGFYELMQRYRHAKDAGISPAPAEAFEDVKAAILAALRRQETPR